MSTAAVLWHPPRGERAPLGFSDREEQLLALVAAVGRRFTRAALASSLSPEDLVIAHAIVATDAAIEVFVIDTGRLHHETLALLCAVEGRLGRRLIVLRPEERAVAEHVAAHGEFGFYESVQLRHACCHLRKVEPLHRALAGRDAWLTGQRRVHGPDRLGLAVEEWDERAAMAKFNPLAGWTDDAVWHYVDRHELPVNPLHGRGYPSIGCEPCTRAIRADEDTRAGRWWWESGHAKECGLHVRPPAPAAEHPN